MDKSASRSQTFQTTHPHLAAAPLPESGAPGFSLWQSLHLGLTSLLALGVAVLVGLLVAGKLRYGEPAPAAAPSPVEKKPATRGKEAEKGGRYQIEVKDDLQGIIGKAGNLGFFGEYISEAQVFKYKGGFLECWLEPETYGKPARGAPVPQEWAKLLQADQGLRNGETQALVKEGHILVAAMKPQVMQVVEALEPYYPHWGGMFVVGPAGPLHQLTTIHLPSSHWQIYRILISADPPTGKRGGGFNHWTGQVVNVRQPFIPLDLHNEEQKLGGGTDLAPDAEATLMERQRGLTRIRLKARFLSDDAVTKAAAMP